MSYLVDTDWVVDYLKGRPDAVELLQSLAPEGLSMSIITYGEIYEGIVDNPEQQRHEQGFGELLSWVTISPLSSSCMRVFARLRSNLRRQGQLIPDLIF